MFPGNANRKLTQQTPSCNTTEHTAEAVHVNTELRLPHGHIGASAQWPLY